MADRDEMTARECVAWLRARMNDHRSMPLTASRYEQSADYLERSISRTGAMNDDPTTICPFCKREHDTPELLELQSKLVDLEAAFGTVEETERERDKYIEENIRLQSRLDEQSKIMDALEQQNGANIQRCGELQGRLEGAELSASKFQDMVHQCHSEIAGLQSRLDSVLDELAWYKNVYADAVERGILKQPDTPPVVETCHISKHDGAGGVERCHLPLGHKGQCDFVVERHEHEKG